MNAAAGRSARTNFAIALLAEAGWLAALVWMACRH